MTDFKDALIKKINDSRFNQFGLDNYDEYRFGKIDPSWRYKPKPLDKLKLIVKKAINYKTKADVQYSAKIISELKDYESGLEFLFKNLIPSEQELVVSLIAYRWLGFVKVKLDRNNPEYWNAINMAQKLNNPNDTYDPHFEHFVLEKFDLKPIGYNIQLFFSAVGIAIDYIIEQYAYKRGNEKIVEAESGDFVLDVGGCWGDTALYFSHKVGKEGRVYSFEFVPENIKLFGINTHLNEELNKRIELVPHPVSNISGSTIYFKDNGPGSRVESVSFEGYTGTATTITIDDFVKQNQLNKVDFIKMDIEGAEPYALKGAIETIRKYKPKLAIAIYHSMDDFVNIPKWILDLDLGYEIHLGHYTIHAEETICFAKIKSK